MKKHFYLFVLLSIFLFQHSYSQNVENLSRSNITESSFHASQCTDPSCIYAGGYTLKFDDNCEETTITIDLSLTGIGLGNSITGVYSGAVMVFPLSIWGNTVTLSVTKPIRAVHGDILPVTIETSIPSNTGYYQSYYFYHIDLIYSTEP